MSDNITNPLATGAPDKGDASGKGDEEMNKNSYKAIMDFSTTVGVPGALGLTSMFTSLVMASGVMFSIFIGIITFVAVYAIAKMFFSH